MLSEMCYFDRGHAEDVVLAVIWPHYCESKCIGEKNVLKLYGVSIILIQDKVL